MWETNSFEICKDFLLEHNFYKKYDEFEVIGFGENPDSVRITINNHLNIDKYEYFIVDRTKIKDWYKMKSRTQKLIKLKLKLSV